jgi:hypothetical protein
MEPQGDYYIALQIEFLQEFDSEAEPWRAALSRQFGPGFAAQVIEESREQYQSLLSKLPYIGGEENQLTSSPSWIGSMLSPLLRHESAWLHRSRNRQSPL